MKFLGGSVFVLLLLTSCNRYYDHVIESDYSYDGRFNRYKTYTYATNPNFEGTIEHRQFIEEFLSQNLDFWGYEKVEQDPELIVFYNLFLKDLNFKGFTQPDFEEWIKERFDDEIVVKDELVVDEQDGDSRNSRRSDEEKYDKMRYALKDGTLLISLYDPKKKKTVWQGYASGVLSTNEGNFDNERIIRHIIARIMHKYRILAVKNS